MPHISLNLKILYLFKCRLVFQSSLVSITRQTGYCDRFLQRLCLNPFTTDFMFNTLEIPLFHVMTASVTFGNINGHIDPAPHISLHMEPKKAEPVAVTTSTSTSSMCGARIAAGVVKHRGSSVSHEEEEEEGGGELVQTSEDTLPVPAASARYGCRMYAVKPLYQESGHSSIRIPL